MSLRRYLIWSGVLLLGVFAGSYSSANEAKANPAGEGELLEESIAFEIEREVHQQDTWEGQPPPADGDAQGSGGEQQAGYGNGGGAGSGTYADVEAPRPGANYCVEGEGVLNSVCVGLMDQVCGFSTPFWDTDCDPDPVDPQQPADGETPSEETAAGEEPAPLPVVTEQDFAELPIQAATVGFEPELLGFGYRDSHTNVFADVETQVLSREMLGYQVEIRAIPAEYHFDYGDGTTLRSFEAGGQLPDYDSAGYEVDKTDTETATSHVYTETGVYPVTISTVYIGEYRIEGGEWISIPGSTSIDSSPGQADIWRISSRSVGGECESPEAWGCNGPVELEPGEEPPAVFEDQYDHNGNWTG